MDTLIRDKDTLELIDHIQRVEFSDFHIDTPKWVAILHRYIMPHQFDEDDELVTYQEQVYIEIGVD